MYYPTKSGRSICIFIQFSGEGFQQAEENIFESQRAHGIGRDDIILPYLLVAEAQHHFTEHLPFLDWRLNIDAELDIGLYLALLAFLTSTLAAFGRDG